MIICYAYININGIYIIINIYIYIIIYIYGLMTKIVYIENCVNFLHYC